MTVKKSCKYFEYGSFEHLLFLCVSGFCRGWVVFIWGWSFCCCLWLFDFSVCVCCWWWGRGVERGLGREKKGGGGGPRVFASNVYFFDSRKQKRKMIQHVVTSPRCFASTTIVFPSRRQDGLVNNAIQHMVTRRGQTAKDKRTLILYILLAIYFPGLQEPGVRG